MNTEQKFGGLWTVQKLDAVEKYLQFYTTALKRKAFKLCYIDAFSGSGNVTLRNGLVIDGSALRALKYPFDVYYFFEKNENYFKALSDKIKTSYLEMLPKIKIVNGDCNDLLQNIDKKSWIGEGWRGVIFLDPFAMELSWSCLEKISKTQAFDVWYLFPLSAVNRNLPKSGEIHQSNENILTKVFGSDDWKEHIYKESMQMTLMDEAYMEKVTIEEMKQYIIKLLNKTFPTVSPNSAILRNDKNSPLFLLCFAGSNPNPTAHDLSLRGANYILKHI